ncbi:MAG: hypothetical protein AAB402_03170 [Patescibacteria group bacterium]
MADDKQKDPKADRLTFSQAIGQAFNDVWQLGKLGLVGTIVTVFLREEQGRQIVGHLAGLTGHAFERIGIEGGPIARDVTGWSVHAYEQFRRAILRAIGLIVLAAALSLLTVAYVPWGGVRGLVGTAGIVLVVYITHDLWVRWIPVIIGIGAAIGAIDAAAAKSATENLRNPFQIVFGGIKQVPPSISWVLNFWKWMAMICIWYAVGVLYVILVPLHQTPGLIPMALPVIPLFFMIPLAEPWLKRGTQYTWILWAGVFYLIDIALLAIFREELYDPIMDGNFWARVIMVGVVGIEVIYAIKLATKSQKPEPQPTAVAGYMFPSQRFIKSPRRMHPVVIVLLIAAGLWVGLYFMDPSHEPMIPYRWILGK